MNTVASLPSTSPSKDQLVINYRLFRMPSTTYDWLRHAYTDTHSHTYMPAKTDNLLRSILSNAHTTAHNNTNWCECRRERFGKRIVSKPVKSWRAACMHLVMFMFKPELAQHTTHTHTLSACGIYNNVPCSEVLGPLTLNFHTKIVCLCVVSFERLRLLFLYKWYEWFWSGQPVIEWWCWIVASLRIRRTHFSFRERVSWTVRG